MSDRAALLKAICANPDEDSPRLVYADWLDEHGESKRAAYIRAQVEFHRLSAADTATVATEEFLSNLYDDGSERVDWGAVDANIGAQMAARKADEKPFKLTDKAEGLPRVKGTTFSHHARGFFDTAFVEKANVFLKHADAIFRAAPITCVHFQQITGEQADEFVASGHLARLRSVSFDYSAEPDAIRTIGTHPDAAGVRELDVTPDPDDAEEAVEALAAGKHWTGLHTLSVSDLDDDGGESLGDELVARLLARPQFRTVRKLDAWGSNIDDDAVRAIVKNMPELRTLDLSLNPLGPDAARILATAKNLPHLRVLELGSCELADADVGTLISSARLPSLTVLRLDGNDLTGGDTKALKKSGRGPGLRALDLGDSELSPEFLEALVKCPAMRSVWYFSLQSSRFGDDHAEAFARSAAFERLVYLNLSINGITSRGAKALAGWSGAANLQWLDLSANKIREPGARAIADSPHFTGLKYILAGGPAAAVLKKRFKKVFA